MSVPLLVMSFCVGILIGLTSMGGAALMAPFLIVVLGVRPVTAVGTDLIYGAVTKAIGAWVHWKQGTVDMKIVQKLAKGSIPGGLVGSFAVFLLPRLTRQSERVEQSFIGALLVFVSIVLLAWTFVRGSTRFCPPMRGKFMCNQGVTIWGVMVGLAVGLTSVGSGSLLAPFLLMLYPYSPAKVVGTDVFHAALLVSVTGMAHAASGGVQWNLLPSLLVGALPGVVLGSRLAMYVPDRPLRAAIAAILLLTGLRMI